MAAVSDGETLRLACFLAASFGPLPRRAKSGWLYVARSGASWTPFLGSGKERLPLQLDGLTLAVTREGSEWTSLLAEGDAGRIELQVPTADVSLVLRFLQPDPP
jgi:hypothetical protein